MEYLTEDSNDTQASANYKNQQEKNVMSGLKCRFDYSWTNSYNIRKHYNTKIFELRMY